MQSASRSGNPGIVPCYLPSRPKDSCPPPSLSLVPTPVYTSSGLQRQQWATAEGIARPKQNARTGRAAEWAPKEPPTTNECALHPAAQAPGRISDCPPGGIPRRLIPAAPALHEEYGGKASSNERPQRPAESAPIRSSLVPTGFRPDHCLRITSRVDTPLMPASLRPALIWIPAPHTARLQRAGPLRTPPDEPLRHDDFDRSHQGYCTKGRAPAEILWGAFCERRHKEA
jgi:hypothetical protein